jgi:hypothetical protein
VSSSSSFLIQKYIKSILNDQISIVENDILLDWCVFIIIYKFSNLSSVKSRGQKMTKTNECMKITYYRISILWLYDSILKEFEQA